MKTSSKKFSQPLFINMLFLIVLTLSLAACSQDQPTDKAPKAGSTPTPTPTVAPATSAPPPPPSVQPDAPVSAQVTELLKSSFLLDDVLFVLNSYKTREAAAEYFIPHVAVYAFNESYTDGDILTDEFLAQDKPPVYSFRLRYNKDSEEITGALVALIPEQGEKGKELAALALAKAEGPPSKDESQKSITYQLGILALKDGRKMQMTMIEDVFSDKSIYTVVWMMGAQTGSAEGSGKKG